MNYDYDYYYYYYYYYYCYYYYYYYSSVVFSRGSSLVQWICWKVCFSAAAFARNGPSAYTSSRLLRAASTPV